MTFRAGWVAACSGVIEPASTSSWTTLWSTLTCSSAPAAYR